MFEPLTRSALTWLIVSGLLYACAAWQWAAGMAEEWSTRR